MTPASGGWIQPRRVHRVMAVRASIQADSKLICGAGPYDLVMFVRESREAGEIELSGRINRSGEDRSPVTGLALALIDEAGRPATPRFETDEFGEFRVRAESRERYGLRVGDEEDAPIVLVWDEANW